MSSIDNHFYWPQARERGSHTTKALCNNCWYQSTLEEFQIFWTKHVQHRYYKSRVYLQLVSIFQKLGIKGKIVSMPFHWKFSTDHWRISTRIKGYIRLPICYAPLKIYEELRTSHCDSLLTCLLIWRLFSHHHRISCFNAATFFHLSYLVQCLDSWRMLRILHNFFFSQSI